MKKHLLPLFVAFVATIGFTSCEPQDTHGTFSGYEEAKLTQEFPAKASKTGSITFTIDCDWSAAVEGTDVEWLTLDETSGVEGESTIKFTLLANDTEAIRTAKVVITCETATELIVNISQEAAVINDFSNYDDEKLEVTLAHHEGIVNIFKFTAKSTWTITEDSDWLIMKQSEILIGGSSFGTDTTVYNKVMTGGEKGEFEACFEITKNETTSDRIATVLLTCGETTLTFNLTQKFDPKALVNFSGYYEDMENINATFDPQELKAFIFNSKCDWTVGSDLEWATIIDSTGAVVTGGKAGDDKYFIIALENNGTVNDRVATITLEGGDGTITGEIKIKVTQAKMGGFGGYLLRTFDKDGNGVISDEEATHVTEIDCSGLGLTDLAGIERFAGTLTTLDCSDNELTELLVFGGRGPAPDYIEYDSFYKLKTVNCSGNKIVTLDVSQHIKQFSLDCSPMETLTTIYANLSNPMQGGQRIPGICGDRNQVFDPEVIPVGVEVENKTV